MKVLVIGGAGYIGSHVSLALLEKNHSVTIFDNLSSGCRENIFPETNFIRGDILDYPALLSAVKEGFDGIIHLAAFKAAGESMLKPEKYSINNITGTINILNASVEGGIRRIVFSSSAAVYGEPEYIPIDEKHPKNPENYYGFTKLKIEEFLSWYERLKGLKFASLRYFNAAGYDVDGRIKGLEKNPANLIPVIMEVAAGIRAKLQIFGDDYPTKDGTCIRDYIHVSDLAAAHQMALEYIDKKNRSLTLNLGSERGISVLEILDTARRVTGKSIPSEITTRRDGDPAKLIASAKNAKDILNWETGQSDPATLIESSWEIYKKSFETHH